MKTLVTLIIALALAGGVFAQTSTQIPMAGLGIEVDKKVDKQLPFMVGNNAVIECPLQAMRGSVSANGLAIKSLSKEEGAGDFILRPLSYSKGELNTLGNGLIFIENNAVLLNRGNLTERFTASTDGIRQDFILANAPVGTQDLSVMLELKGAVATNSAQGVSIKMDNGRNLEYHNLYITDAAGKVLKGEMKAVSEGLIAINVNDANAVYPLTIDPTITDADWVALNTSIPGTDYDINAIAISGTDIYVGGAFAAAGSGLANRIAKWDGSAWSALGSGVSGTVYSLAISGTDLYVGGYFATAGGITVNNIAKWDITTSTWSALGSGVSSDVKALAISGTDVYAGGVFTTAGGNPANRIAKWNGTAWSALGAGLDNRVLCIAISGSDIYVGGRFRNAGGSSADRIAKWNITTSTWSALGSGANNYVLALAINGTDLYAGGSFSTAGGNSANRIAKWNITTSAWSALGSGLSGNSNEARAIAISGSDVYVGGAFTTAGEVTVGRIAKWDGTSWSALGSGLNDNLQAIAISGSGDLYVGGYLTSAGDVVASKIAKWNGTAWSALGSGLNASVSAIAINGGDMYIGGGLLQVGNVPASKIAKWNGSVWSALGTGVELTNGRNVSAIAISGGDVYVGGGFTTAGGITVNNIAKWDGTAWSALGSGVGSSVSSIAISGSDVYAGGYFTTAGGASANAIAKWNGTAWSALGTGLNSNVAAIAINGSNVYAGGPFTTAGGNPANYIAKWDGTSWSALGSGLGAQLTSIAISGSNVYAAGAFTTSGGVAANYIAKWDETTATWTALGSGVNSYIYTIATTGSDVYAGGGFTTAGGVSANSIAKWDGTAWSALGSGVNASPYALAMNGTSELIVGGGFMTAGDKFSPYLAKVVISSVAAPTMFEFTPGSAATGETVTISGTNLTGTTAVSFGGTAAASFTVTSATEITAVVGAGASGSVSVNTPGGTATLEGFAFISTLTITSFTPTSAGTGTFISITGTNFTGATAVRFGGTAAVSFNVDNATTISAMVADGTTGTVSVTTPGGTATSAGTFTYKPAYLTNLANTNNGCVAGNADTYWNGQAFTTGSNSLNLSSVDLSIFYGGDEAVVKIYSSSAGIMGSPIATLTGTYVSGDIWNFTPATPLTLSANTTYWLVLYSTWIAESTNSTNYDYTDVLTYTGSGTIPTTNRVAFSGNAGVNWEYYSASDPAPNYSSPFMFALYGDIIVTSVTWDGSESTAWNTAGNWSGNAVPTSSDDVTIPDVTNDPEVNITNAVCNNMTISSGAVLTIPAGKALTVSGTLTNNSTGGVVIQSDATGTGSLIMGTAAGSGSTIAGRYMTTDAWHLVAPPLSGQLISGFLTANSDIAEKAGVRGMMDYNPSGNVWNGFFTDATAGSLTMGNGFGMRTATNSAVTFTGQPSAGHLTLTGLISGKWNCVGNPYTSAMAINANTGKASTFLEDNAVLNANIDPGYGAIYIWDKGDAQNDLEDQYTIINNASEALYVQQGQAFLVKMNTSATSVVFFDEMQVHDPTLALKSTDNSWERIKLYAKCGNRSGFTQIAFNSAMTRGLDPTYDAGMLKGSTNLAVYTRLVDDNGFPFSIQALPNNGFDTMVIPVGLDFIAGGEVTFSAELQNLSPDCQPILEDNLTHTFTDLSSHSYTVSIPANSIITNRFRLHTSKLSSGLNDETSGNGLRAFVIKNSGIRVLGMVTGNTLATVYDIQGRVIVQRRLQNSGDNIIPTPNFGKGIYLLSLTGGSHPQQFKIQVIE